MLLRSAPKGRKDRLLKCHLKREKIYKPVKRTGSQKMSISCVFISLPRSRSSHEGFFVDVLSIPPKWHIRNNCLSYPGKKRSVGTPPFFFALLIIPCSGDICRKGLGRRRRRRRRSDEKDRFLPSSLPLSSPPFPKCHSLSAHGCRVFWGLVGWLPFGA